MFISVKILITFHAEKTLVFYLTPCSGPLYHAGRLFIVIIVITWLWRNPIVILNCESWIESGSQACNSSQDSSMRRTRYISQSSTTRSSVNLLSKVGCCHCPCLCLCIVVIVFSLCYCHCLFPVLLSLALSLCCCHYLLFVLLSLSLPFLCIVCTIAFWYYARPILTIRISVTKIGLMYASQTTTGVK